MIIRYFNSEKDIKELSEEELLRILFSAEQISQAVRQIVSSREIYYRDYVNVENNQKPNINFEDGILEILIPPPVKRPKNESWYLASMVRKGLQDLSEDVDIKQPYFLVCERIIPNNKTVVQDNDNLEIHRIINECMKFLGSTDHPLKMGYASIARVEPDKHYARICIMNKRDSIEFLKNAFAEEK